MREPVAKYGAPTLHIPRLGQGIFRVKVLDAYGRACAVTGEHSLPVLEADHIRGHDPLKIMQRAGHVDFQTTQEYVREAEAVREAFGLPSPFSRSPSSMVRHTVL